MERQPQKARVRADRVGPTLTPDRSRVLLRPFFPNRKDIARRIVNQILSLSDEETVLQLHYVLGEFDDRHQNLHQNFRSRYRDVKEFLSGTEETSPDREALIGSYFTLEYSPESAALFNPSIVLHPDQTGLPEDTIRFVLSLRATGEGHVSSVTFRTGIVNSQHRVVLKHSIPVIAEAEVLGDATLNKALFLRKLGENGLNDAFANRVLRPLADDFRTVDLAKALGVVQTHRRKLDTKIDRESDGLLRTARSNYEVQFNADSLVSQRVLFPKSPSQSHGIEDVRLVRFHEPDGSWNYYGTYTAYDGHNVEPQLLKTADFVRFQFRTLSGSGVLNKGMALFPRQIQGRYVMLSRQDDENILIMTSDHVEIWNDPQVLLKPMAAWEMVKIGTCGSPIETDAGWLVLTHGVGAMRKYCLGAFLLDIEDPTKVLGRLKNPLMSPNEAEREGYVPNVVYTCGALLHGRELVIPYAVSDYATSFATVNLDQLLGALE
jgi:predicted GH43/DUF377 family glycosyl hydrolase